MSWLSRKLAKLGCEDAFNESSVKAIIESEVEDGIKDLYYVSDGTFSYLDAGGEQETFSLSPAANTYIFSVLFDTSNLTQDGTFKVYYMVDGSNYRQINALDAAVTGGTTQAVCIDINTVIDGGVKVTYTEGADEGADRDIPYEISYKVVG